MTRNADVLAFNKPLRLMVRAVVIAGAVASGISTTAWAQTRTITLDDAVGLAIRNNPNVIQAEGDLRTAEAQRLEYYGDWLPSITGSSGFSTNSASRFDQATQRTVSGNATSYSAGLTASYTLFDGFRRSANGRTSRANIESAEASLIDQRFQTILQTKQAFFQAVAAEDLVRVAETRIERAEGQLRITREKLAAGSAIRSDTLRSFVELANARLQLLNAQTQRTTAEATLARIIGLDEPVRALRDPSMDVVVDLDTNAIREEALEQSPSLQQATASARAADAQVTASRATYFPSLNASYSQNWAGSDFGNLNNTWSARLSLSWPIFNGFARERGVAQSRASQTTAYARVEDARRQINAVLAQQFAALESARVRIDIAVASGAAAEEDVRVQQERYQLGASTIVDLLAAQLNLDQVEVDLVQARLDFFLAKAELEALVGHEL